MCLYGAGAKKVAATVSQATGEPYSVEEAEQNIEDYFNMFSTLKKWLKEKEKEIKANGFAYSLFGRKRRLANVFSSDRGIAGGEVRSGINSLIQSVCSDINLFAAINTHEYSKQNDLDAKIFMLVHDSIVSLVRDDLVDDYSKVLAKFTQEDMGCTIPGAPIGIDQDIGQDYSFGKFEKMYRLEYDKTGEHQMAGLLPRARQATEGGRGTPILHKITQ